MTRASDDPRTAEAERISYDQLEELATVARRLAEAPSLDELLQRIVDLGEHHVDNCDGVSLMLIRRGGGLSTPAYSSAVAYASDMAQYETNQGPCLEAIREHEAIVIDDLRADDRWPAYRKAALALGVRSMLGMRLFVLADTMGALDFYSATPHAFGHRARLLAEVFASHAAVALKAAISESGLHAALETRDVIGQAKGVLMERERLTPEAAFARLREVSQRQNRSIRDLAVELAESGQLPP